MIEVYLETIDFYGTEEMSIYIRSITIILFRIRMQFMGKRRMRFQWVGKKSQGNFTGN